MDALRFLVGLYQEQPAAFGFLAFLALVLFGTVVWFALDFARSAVVPKYEVEGNPVKETFGRVGTFDVLGLVVYNKIIKTNGASLENGVILQGFLAGNVETLVLLCGRSGFIFFKPSRVMERVSLVHDEEKDRHMSYSEAGLFKDLADDGPVFFSWRGGKYVLLESGEAMVRLSGAHPYLNQTANSQEVKFWLAVEKSGGLEREAIFVEEPVNDWLNRRNVHKQRVWIGSELSAKDTEEALSFIGRTRIVHQPLPEVIPIRYGQRAF
jgi:hypothetical protein